MATIKKILIKEGKSMGIPSYKAAKLAKLLLARIKKEILDGEDVVITGVGTLKMEFYRPKRNRTFAKSDITKKRAYLKMRVADKMKTTLKAKIVADEGEV